MKKILTLMVCCIFTTQTFANDTIRPNINYAHAQMQQYVSTLNEKNYVEYVRTSALFSVFTTKEDKLYFQKMSATLPMPKNIKAVVTEKNEIIVTMNGADKMVLSDLKLGSKAFKLNGQAFEITQNESLENFVNRLSKATSKKAKTSFFELFFPEAHAVQLAGVAVAAFLILIFFAPTIANVATYYDVGNSLDKSLSECKNRDPSVAFQDSKTALLYEQIKSKGILDKGILDNESEVRQMQSCGDWARAHHTKDSLGDVETMTEWCQTTKQLFRCIDDYKKGVSPKETTSSTPNQSSGNK